MNISISVKILHCLAAEVNSILSSPKWDMENYKEDKKFVNFIARLNDERQRDLAYLPFTDLPYGPESDDNYVSFVLYNGIAETLITIVSNPYFKFALKHYHDKQLHELPSLSEDKYFKDIIEFSSYIGKVYNTSLLLKLLDFIFENQSEMYWLLAYMDNDELMQVFHMVHIGLKDMNCQGPESLQNFINNVFNEQDTRLVYYDWSLVDAFERGYKIVQRN